MFPKHVIPPKTTVDWPLVFRESYNRISTKSQQLLGEETLRDTKWSSAPQKIDLLPASASRRGPHCYHSGWKHLYIHFWGGGQDFFKREGHHGSTYKTKELSIYQHKNQEAKTCKTYVGTSLLLSALQNCLTFGIAFFHPWTNQGTVVLLHLYWTPRVECQTSACQASDVGLNHPKEVIKNDGFNNWPQLLTWDTNSQWTNS